MTRGKPRGAHILIIGGGMAGLTVAHELIERNFEVTILDRLPIAGGKARSIIENRLPGEHGFRFFPGFYRHCINSMERIPSFDGRTVAEHVVPTSRVAITQYDKPMYVLPAGFPRAPTDAGSLLRAILTALTPITELSPSDFALFGARIWQFLTSCADRRLHEYERIPWWIFVAAEGRSRAYQKFLAEGITRSLVAAKARTASTRTIGDIFVQLMFDIIDISKATTDRVLDGPTNLVWVDPWKKHLEALGVTYIAEAEVDQIDCVNGKITGIKYNKSGRRHLARADYYIAAIPVERIITLLTPQLLAADPSLANLRQLARNVEWMNGVQFYLRRPLPLTHGHVIHIDTEWALTSISQPQFWHNVPADQFDTTIIKEILSVDISDFTAPGTAAVNHRTAKQCSREEVVRETWRQLKRSIGPALNDRNLVSWFFDPDIQPDLIMRRCLRNEEPLLVNLVNTWALRPNPATAIPNLFLASDYVRTHTDLATMEGANEAARHAANRLLDAVNFDGSRCELWPLHEPEILLPWRAYDQRRFDCGQPWDAGAMPVAAHIIRDAAPVLDLAAPIMATIRPFLMPLADVLEFKAAGART